MIIRREETKDHRAVFDLIREAFENEVYTDHNEQFLVERLRRSEAFIPELSLVADNGGEIVGYILLTKIAIVNGDVKVPSLALAPVAVLPSRKGKGVGGQLIKAAHQEAKALNFASIVLLGHEGYYPRFGYQKASDFGVILPFDVPDENCMVIELKKNALKNVQGTVEYPKAFYG